MRRLETLLIAALLPATAAAAPPTKGQPTASESCGSCHKDIYRMWSASAHADAMEDPIFLAAYRETESRQGKAVARVCLGCHAPVVEATGDVELKQKITWEGVNCDVCHSLVSVEVTSSGVRQTMEFGPVKLGPIENAASTGHEVAYSELHASAEVCAGCHEFRNSEGTPLMTTYSEWRSSSSAEKGQTCQVCHMFRTEAQVVDPKIKRIEGAEVNLHEVPGGHSLDQLHKALSVHLQPARDGGELTLPVRLTNKGAGHAVPTGMPGRRVILVVEVRTSDGKSFREKRVYSKSFKDKQGQIIVRDSDYFSMGVSLETDSRIQPDEQRTEIFRFPVSDEATAYLTLKLHYEHAPTGGEEGRTWLTFYSEDRILVP